jgi:lysophospholipase L1-like esterase
VFLESKRFTAAAFGFALALVAFEPLLRFIHYAPVVWNPVLGPIFQPGSVVTFRTEGSGRSHWRDNGVRRATAAASNSKQIVVLGDSYVEALMLDDGQELTSQAEDLLAPEIPGVSVINLGRSDRSAADFVALAPWIEETFAPQWVVVQLGPSDVGADALAESKTHFRRTPAGGIELVVNIKRGALWHALLPLRRHSSLLDLSISRLPKMVFSDEPPLFRGASSVPVPPAFDLSLAAAMLNELRSAYDGRLTLLYLPDFDPSGTARVDAFEEFLTAWCVSNGTSLVNLRDAFPRFRETRQAPYGFANTTFNWGHLNAEGHAAAGRLLADDLSRLHRRGLF